MTGMRSQMSLCLTLWLGLSLIPGPASAQLAPTGGHYAGRASDTGHEPGMVNASGGYVVSVPLDLPAARGGLPVPLQITSGVRGVGAAGLGWEVPLSYVRRNMSMAGRRPSSAENTAPQARQQILLSFQGRVLDMVPKGQTWVARNNAPELSLREQGDTWTLYDGEGRTYTFNAPQTLAGTDLWLLSAVSGPAGAAMQLAYDIGTPALPGASGLSIDLVRIAYNFHPQTGCAKHEIDLTYWPPPSTAPLWLSIMGDRVLARMHTLRWVDVMSRADCATSAERLRRYELAYLPDTDTQQPRLQTVQMFGRLGTPEENTAVPIASYGYGAASNSGKLKYQKTQTIALPADADMAKISSTATDAGVIAPGLAGVGYATWQSLTDVTGDGRPDLIYRKNGALWVALNRPAAGGSTTLGANQAVAQLSDATFANGAFETRTATNNRFTYGADNRNVDHVWRQAIDVNGDGRVDIIDAAEEAGYWVVYLNTPGAGPSGVTWVRRTFSITQLRQDLEARGHWMFDDFVPLSRRFTGRDRHINACWQFDGTNWVPFPGGWNGNPRKCFGDPNHVLDTGPEETFTEWEVKDINGDGYPDVVFNSSPVDLVLKVPPTSPSDKLNDVRGGSALIKAQPRDNANHVDAALNARGVLFDENVPLFSAPITIRPNTLCGVALWTESGGTQETICALADVNGDGIVDRIENRTDAYLGTGSGFSPVHLTLPGPIAIQRSAQVLQCASPATGATTFTAGQPVGMRDLTGDGIPDYVEPIGAGSQVWIGTGAGFAPPIPIDGPYGLSGETERCDGSVSNTTSGLYDIDGDGKPEMVVLNGPNLDVYQLVGGAVPGTPEAGHIVQVDNGYGAKTTIAYRSAKEDGITLHQVPFPEVVVTSVETTGTQGLGGTLSATRFAYGGAELMFDSALDAFTLPGYGRSVELRVISVQEGKAEGWATLTDTYPLVPFVQGSNKDVRFGRYLRAGRVRDVTVLAGSVTTDPWPMLATDVTTDTRRIGGTHYDWDSRLFQEPNLPDVNALNCMEMMYPLDYVRSVVVNISQGDNFLDVCTSHGFMFALATQSWRGDEAPPSTSNVATATEVRNIDEFGRLLTVRYLNDVFRDDDDVCVDTAYAVPTGQNERVLSAPSSRRLWDCKTAITYATEYLAYDNLPAGNVSTGFVTSHSLERHATDDGTLLSTVRTFDASYDAAGNPSSITSQREDGATRKVSLQYDPFGLASVGTRIDATGTPPIEVTTVRDAISLKALSTTDATQTQRGMDFDGFERVVRSTVTPPGGALGVLSTVSYLGFVGSDPLGRRVVRKNFTDPVAPASVGAALGRTGTVYLDELGRERRTELALGSDYANQMLIAGARSYDSLGRVAFQADPYPSSQDGATAYGDTYLFQPDGSPSCFIRGRGPQPLIQLSNPATELYPTCFSRSYTGHQETTVVSGASSLTAGTPQTGVTKTETLTAIGRLISRSTWKGGSRLEHATFGYDQIGQLTSLTRYLDPIQAAKPVQSSWRLDSFGRVLLFQEPESAAQSSRYSDWGELLEVQWTDTTVSPSVDHRVATAYDALGRVTHREERNNGVTDPATLNDYLYDVGVSVVPQVTPTNVLGRLAQAKAPTGDISFSYDAFGQVNARTFTDHQGGTYVEKTTLHADGTPSALDFYLPDTGFMQERVDYGYDSAARLRSMKSSDGSGSQVLYEASDIDPFGRVRKARYGGSVDYVANYADLGRRLIHDVNISSALGSRRIGYLAFDAEGRELSRREIKDGAPAGPKTDVVYDALGRVSSAVQTAGATTLFNRQFDYDALGNALTLDDVIGTADATLSYRGIDRDRVCRVGYGDGGLGGKGCNVLHDGAGNIVRQPTRTGQRVLSYFASGNVRAIDESGVHASSAHARFRYDAFGAVQELDLQGNGTTDTRHDRRYGELIERRDQVAGTTTTSFISRKIPGPGGIVASRRGSGNDWVFQFGEPRGNRFFTTANGAFVQDVAYMPFGESKSTGVQPGSAEYTNYQWNGGDGLAAFGLTHVGARLYDPVIGRFLSRDPLLLPRTAATTNPYAFAMNDPVNLSDPSGLDCIDVECQGPGGSGGFPGGGPSGINPPGLYFPVGAASHHANPQAAYRPPIPAAFFGAPQEPQSEGGLKTGEGEDEGEFPLGAIEKGAGVTGIVTAGIEHSLEHTLGKASPILRNLRVFGKVIHGIELISSGAEVISDPSPENISGFVFTTGEVIAVAAGGWEAIVVVSFVDVFMWAVRPSSVNALEQKVDLMSQKLDILIQRNRQYYSTQASWQPEMGPLTYGEYLRSMGEPTFADYLNGLYQPK